MKNWITKITLLLMAGATYIAGQYYSNPQYFGFCKTRPYQSDLCLADTAINTGWPLIAAGEILAIVGVVLLFASKEGVRKWAWMSIVYLPLSALIISSINPHPSGWITLTPSREHVTWLLGYGYILATFAIVAGTRWAARHSLPRGSTPTKPL